MNVVGGELLLLLLLIVIILGPSKLPHYAAKLRDFTIVLRDMAKGAHSQLREEMGPAFDEVDWKQLDPRQYDPRRIVREALADGQTPTTAAGQDPRPQVARTMGVPAVDPLQPTPFDIDAT